MSADFSLSPPSIDALLDRYGLEMLKEGGDLSIVDGGLAVTEDGDLMLGDVPFNALYRLVEHWRCTTPHLQNLHLLAEAMKVSNAKTQERLDRAANVNNTRIRETGVFGFSPDFLVDWHSCRDAENSAIIGNHTYAGCIILLTSGVLGRFKDDLTTSDTDWDDSGSQFGGQSVGRIVAAAANGFRHEDEWAKARTPTSQQKRSQNVLSDALGPRSVGLDAPPGRCPEILDLLAGGGGFDGLTRTVLGFAHEVAQRRRATLRRGTK